MKKIKAFLEAYLNVRPISYEPKRKMWICPECRRLAWSCADLGPEARAHEGWTKDRGQTTPPRCVRHPDVPMVKEDPTR